MNNINKNLSEIFDVEPLPEPKILPALKQTKTDVVSVGDVVEDDSNLARENIKSLIDKGGDAIDNLLLVAQQSEHPRAYEVAANFIKTLADLNKDLLEIQKKKQDLQPKEVAPKGGINVQQAVFVGSTAELIKQIKENK